MQIGEVIRKYRKSGNMTQEEMANRLGVTAPAVNKWENGNSMPDIMLLAPIARLLNISLETLLSFQEDLTDEEIEGIQYKIDAKFKNETYEDAFAWAKKKMELYPNCEKLIIQLARLLDVERSMLEIANADEYDGFICDCYERVLNSRNEENRNYAADALFGFYVRKEQYEKAETYLEYFSNQNPERKRKQALIYSKTGRVEEAYKAYEELLFSGYQMMNLVLHGVYLLAMAEENREKAHYIIDKQQQLARLFEMGEYHEICYRLELLAAEKDADRTIDTMERMLGCIDDIYSFSRSPLYEHMMFAAPRQEFIDDMKKNMKENFRDEEAFGFLKSDERWRKLTK